MLTKANKIKLSPIECIERASEFAYTAELLLRQNAEVVVTHNKTVSALYPMWSLLYQAFELLLKSYASHTMRTHKHLTSLMSYLEALEDVKQCLDYCDLQLLRDLTKKNRIRNGVQYDADEFELHEDHLMFTDKCLQLFDKMISLMPVELQAIYQT